MSRFFAAESDTSSSESEVEDDLRPKVTAARFTSYAESDESDEGRRIVRSKKAKYLDELAAEARNLSNAQDVGDWNKAEDAYKSLYQKLDRYKKEFSSPPAVLVRALLQLDENIKEAWPNRKKLNKLASKALSKLRSNVNKDGKEVHIGATTVGDMMEEYREKRSELDELVEQEKGAEEQVEEESEGSEGEAEVEVAKPLRKAVTGEESDSDFWPSGDSEESDTDEEGGMTYTADYFLKKDGTEGEGKRERKQRVKPKEKVQVEGEDEEDDGFQVVGKRNKPKKEQVLFQKDEDITPDAVLEKFAEINEARGRKSTSHAEQRQVLKKLRDVAASENLGAGLVALIQQQVVSTHFDEPLTVTGYMRPPAWANCHDDLMYLLTLLLDTKNVLVRPDLADGKENIKDASKPFLIPGDVAGHIERLDEEYIKSLRGIDPFSPDYVYRLQDESVVYNLICLAERYAEQAQLTEQLARIRQRRIEHIYYKREPIPMKKRTPTRELPSDVEDENREVPEPENKDVPTRWVVDDAEERDSVALMDRLCKFIYPLPDMERLRVRTILCHIYHYALCDRWETARDLMLMSHLQEHIAHMDLLTQILYNRAMVQVGLAAFRGGKILEAQTALHEILQLNRGKELLAQGYAYVRFNQLSIEEQNQEKRRQTPFHMHINLELIEMVFHTTSMLTEIPSIAHQQHDPTRYRPYIKAYRRQMEFYCKNAFNGPPENTREHIMAASLKMLHGEWRACRDLILGVKAWKLMPNRKAVEEMLTGKIREAALKTYLFSNGGYYDSISTTALCTKFELPENTVHRIVAKMIHKREIYGNLDQSAGVIVMRKEEPSSLQLMALNFADKISSLVENSERLLDMRTKGGRGGRGGGRGGGGRGGGRGRGGGGGRTFNSGGGRSQKTGAESASGGSGAPATGGSTPGGSAGGKRGWSQPSGGN